ncbi:MAG: hypothetical protein JNK87_04020 [Bryobacterales bacterium]|nr:hypothetical protein [Bryobacterales bacterium]
MRRGMLLVLGVLPLLVAADRPDLSGTWRLEGNDAETLIIAQTDDQVAIASKSPAATEVKCGVSGKACDGTIGGEKVSVSYWFNGPMLVEMATGGKRKDRVVKTRRSLSSDGQKMEVEVIPIAPVGKSEKLTYVKAQP